MAAALEKYGWKGGGTEPIINPNSPTGMKYWMQELTTPVTADIGLSEPERQGIYNLARRQIQSGTNASAAELEGKMGGKGFRAGESGIADTAIGNIYSQGAERLGQVGLQTSIEEAKNRFAQNLALSQLNQNRLLGGGDLSAKLKANQIAGGGLRLGRDQFAWNKEEQTVQDIMESMKMKLGQQNQAYAPYLDYTGRAATGG